MAEAGVDISGQRSKHLDELRDIEFDYVVTVCGHAQRAVSRCFPGKAKIVHVAFDDPPQLGRRRENGKGTGEVPFNAKLKRYIVAHVSASSIKSRPNARNNCEGLPCMFVAESKPVRLPS